MADKRVKIIKHNKVSVKFEVDSRYSPLESIGTGAYGVVCAAKDNRTGQRVAIKKIPKVLEVLVIAKRTYRELKILRHLRHENIISILDVMEPPEDLTQFEDVYVVLDLMETDLHHIIHSVQPLSDEHIKFFLYQILRGLKYIHSANVLHRDLKPSNLLVNRNCELKIGDFGMARGLASSPDEHATFMTEYVATRWYRAPELMLSFSEYTFAIDMWSVGCILAEMLARRQLFPGRDYLNQLQLILSVVGTPDAEYIQGIGSERVKTYLQNLPPRKRVDITVLFPNCGPQAVELLDSLLQLDPHKRPSSEDALGHAYLTRYHDPKDEPICSPPFDFSFEKELVTQEALGKALVDELMDYHKSRVPIPSQDTVKDALKKMMEDREKEREKVEREIENGNFVMKEIKEVKEAPVVGKAKKNKAGKKRKHLPGNQAEQKKLKLEEDQEGLTDKDKNMLSRWKELQQTTRPFIHPVRRLMRPGEVPDAAYVEQQDQLIKQQFAEIEKQHKQILEYEKMIKEQNHLISALREKHDTLVLQCQASGIKLNSDLLDKGAPRNGGSCQHLLPVASSQSSLVSTHANNPVLHPPGRAPTPSSTSSLTPASPANIFSPPIAQPPYPNISPTNRTPPPGPPPSHMPLVRSLHPSVSMDSLSNVDHSQKTTTLAYSQMNPTHLVGAGPHNNRFLPVNQSQMLMGSGAHTGHAQNQMEMGPMSDQVPTSRQQSFARKGVHNSPPMLIDDISFSPLTSSELKEFEPPPGVYLPHPLVSFNEDLDSILNLSMLSGNGAGYGVGVKEEDLSQGSLQIDLSNLGPTTSGPASASLLRDWLDVSQLDPDDMDVLQRELETGAPDVFTIHDFPDL